LGRQPGHSSDTNIGHLEQAIPQTPILSAIKNILVALNQKDKAYDKIQV